jgi:hypothetical protein
LTSVMHRRHVPANQVMAMAQQAVQCLGCFLGLQHMTRRARLVLIPIVGLQVWFFVFIARHRFIDGDEGSYLLASRLVLEHKKPYLDFFYNQAPLLPYIYGYWMKMAGVSWASGRMLCVLLTTLLGVLVYEQVCHQTQSWRAGLTAVVLSVSSTLVFAWLSVVKTHCVTVVLLFGAYVLVSRKCTPWGLALGGLLLGLSVDTRSYIILVAPVFVLWVVRHVDSALKLKFVAWFGGGLVVGLLPAIGLFLAAPDIFLFDNLLYHGVRSSRGLIGWWQEKLVVIVQLFLGSHEANGLQWAVVFVTACALNSATPKRSSSRLALQIAIVTAIICLLPTPTYLQYFSICLPFLIVSTVCGAHESIKGLNSSQQRVAAGIICALAAAAYVGVAMGDVRRYLFTGNGVPGLRLARDNNDWRLERVAEVSRVVEQLASPGEVVASFWPGDIFDTKAAPLSGLENHFALSIADKLTPQQRLRYHITSLADIEAKVASHNPRIIVDRSQMVSAITMEDAQNMERTVESLRRSLDQNGYKLVRSIGDISIYTYTPRS